MSLFQAPPLQEPRSCPRVSANRLIQTELASGILDTVGVSLTKKKENLKQSKIASSDRRIRSTFLLDNTFNTYGDVDERSKKKQFGIFMPEAEFQANILKKGQDAQTLTLPNQAVHFVLDQATRGLFYT